MLPKNRVSTHPGEVLYEEFLLPLGLTQTAFARHIGIPPRRISEVIHGKRGVTSEMAWLFSQALGTSAEFWMDLQTLHDLSVARPKRKISLLRPAI